MIVNCQYCNKEFNIAPAAFKNGKGKFCSNLCKSISIGKVEIECGHCKDKFKIYRYLIRKDGKEKILAFNTNN